MDAHLLYSRTYKPPAPTQRAQISDPHLSNPDPQPSRSLTTPFDTKTSEMSSDHTAFFYGTLMAPQVLHRVCHGTANPSAAALAARLKTQPAVLHGYRRHRVLHADYPAILPERGSAVRGTLVRGLTDGDIWRLDIFEGDEYERKSVRARVLETVGDEKGDGNVEGAELEAETYVWIAGADQLEDREWDFAEFQVEKMGRWVGRQGQAEYAGERQSFLGRACDCRGECGLTCERVDVDDAVRQQAEKDMGSGGDPTRGRGMNGSITKTLEGKHSQKEEENELLKNAV